MRYYFSPVYILSRLEVLHLPIMSRTYFPPCPQMWQCERSSIPLARLCVRARVCVCVCVCALLNFVLGQGDRKPLGLHNRSDGDFVTYGQLCGSRGGPFLESTNNFLQRGILQLVEPLALRQHTRKPLHNSAI